MPGPTTGDASLPRTARALVFSCFFLSGASALIYEVVWVRQLLSSVGATTAAVSTVLAVFMAGLGIGAWWLGRRADHSRSPLKLYAYLEIGIGLYGLVLPDLVGWTRPWYVALARSLEGQPASLTVLRIGLSAALLLLPTILMGGTFPVLVRFLARGDARLGRDLGGLYGVNLAGAVCGSLAAGFVLIRSLGLRGATVTAVLVNLGVGVVALLWSARSAPPVPRSEPEPGSRAAEAPGGSGIPRPLLFAVAMLSGAVSMGYEVLWTRILIFSFTSTVHAFSLILATFLVGLALGSYAFTRVERRCDRVRALVVAQILAGLSAALLAPASAHAASLITAISTRFGYTANVFLAALALSSAAVILLPAALMGLVLPLSMRLLLDDIEHAGKTIGAAYLANTGGSVLGSILTGFGLIPLLGLKGSLLLLAVVQVAAGASLLPWCRVAPSARRRVLAASSAALAVVVVALTVLLRGPAPFDRIGSPLPGPPPFVEAHRDGVTSTVSIVNYPGAGRVLRIDGFAAAVDHRRGGYMAMMTHIPMLLHPEPRRVLVVCFGTGTTAGTALLYPDAHADVVDIDRTVFDFAPYFRDANRDVARSPRARLILDDGRNYLLTSRRRYDVITAEPMPPGFAGMASLYSREYYLLARERLTTGGVVVQWLPMHLLSVEQSLGILRTVQDVFPETTLWVFEDTGIVVARRDTPVRVDLPDLRRRMGMAGLRADLARLGLVDAEDFLDLHVLGPEAVRRVTTRALSVTDDRPWIEFDAPRHKLRPSRGRFRLEQARALQVVFAARLLEPAPVSGATPAEAAAASERRVVSSRLMLGDLARGLGAVADADTLYAEAVRQAREPRTQAITLCHLAEIARQEGRLPDARRLVEESLRLAPATPQALELQALLTDH